MKKFGRIHDPVALFSRNVPDSAPALFYLKSITTWLIHILPPLHHHNVQNNAVTEHPHHPQKENEEKQVNCSMQ